MFMLSLNWTCPNFGETVSYLLMLRKRERETNWGKSAGLQQTKQKQTKHG